MKFIDINPLPPKRERKKVKYDDYISPKVKKAGKKAHRLNKKSKGEDTNSSSPSFSPRMIHILVGSSENEQDPPSPSESQSPPSSPNSNSQITITTFQLSEEGEIINNDNNNIENTTQNENQQQDSSIDSIQNNEAYIKSAIKKKKLEEKLMALNQDLEKISSILNEKKTPRQKKEKKEKRESKEIEMDLDSEINNLFKPSIEVGAPSTPVFVDISPKSNSKKLPNTKPSKTQNKKILKESLVSSTFASPIIRPKNELEIELAPGLLSCQKILRSIMKHKYSFPFLEPVDPIKLEIPDYFTIIKHPMDLGTIKSKLESGKYSNIIDFSKDVHLVFDNACTYNQDGSDVYIMSETLKKIFQKKYAPVFNREKSNLPQELLQDSPSPSPKVEHITTNNNNNINNQSAATQPAETNINSTPRKKRVHETHHQNNMTREEKRKLANDINKLTIPHLNVIVDIVKQCFPDIDKDTDEIAIDVDALDYNTLRDLESFVNKIKRKNKAAKKRLAIKNSANNNKNIINNNTLISNQFENNNENNNISNDNMQLENNKENEIQINNSEDNMVITEEKNNNDSNNNIHNENSTSEDLIKNNNVIEAMVIEQSNIQCNTNENNNNNNNRNINLKESYEFDDDNDDDNNNKIKVSRGGRSDTESDDDKNTEFDTNIQNNNSNNNERQNVHQKVSLKLLSFFFPSN